MIRKTQPIPPYIIRDGVRVYLEPRPVDPQHTDLAKTFKAERARLKPITEGQRAFMRGEVPADFMKRVK